MHGFFPYSSNVTYSSLREEEIVILSYRDLLIRITIVFGTIKHSSHRKHMFVIDSKGREI